MEASSIALSCLIVVIFLLLLVVIDLRRVIDKTERNTNYQNVYYIIGFLGLLSIVFALFAPSFLGNLKISKPNEKIMSPNEIGDMFGGTMAPFVGIGGVIFTFLAFYMQKRANDDIREQFKEQQFDAQFYEMLRLHKENVNEIEVIAKDINMTKNTGETYQIKGNLTFLKHNFNVVKGSNISNLRVYKGREAFRIMKNEFEIYYSETKTIKLNEIDKDDFNAAYELFFWGVKGYSRQDKRNLWEKLDPEKFIHKLQNKILSLINDDQLDDDLNLFFNHETLNEVVLGNGYSAHLGHYYRHLYHTVSFVVENKNLTYERKRNYLKILRGQLSNYEQIMLLYNWMSTYGSDWEDDDNNFFTKYKMIHNLWYNELNLDAYLEQKLYCLVKKYEELKLKDTEMKEMEDGKFLFESGDEAIINFNIVSENLKN